MVKRVIEHPAVPWVAICLAVALVFPSISTGLGSDDYVIASQLRSDHTITGLSRGAHDLFVFAPRDPETSRRLIEEGVFPWWADANARIAFFRPLASLTHALDHRWLSGAPIAWHAHSLIWFALALVSVALLYRRTLGPAAAAIAVALFSLDDAHGPSVGWLAARNGLVALTFSALSIASFVRQRRDPTRGGVYLAPVLLAFALAAGEIAIGAVAYLFAYLVCVEERPWRERLAGTWPFGLVVGAWAIAYVALGYGVSGTSQYVDPLREPGVFFGEAAVRWPLLLLAQLLGPWSDLIPGYADVHPRLPLAMSSLAWLVVIAVVVVSYPVLARDRTARFFALGAALSAVPVCAGMPSDRVLLLVGIGAMGLAASVVSAYAWHRDGMFDGRARRALTGLAVASILVVHVALNFACLPARARANLFFAPAFDRAALQIPRGESVAGRTVVLVNPPFEPLVLYSAFVHDAAGESRPDRVRVLATGASRVSITRLDARTLAVRPERGFLASAADTMLRSPRRPLPIGPVASLSDVAIAVTALTEDGRPAEARFSFRVPLEDPSLVWRRWSGREIVPFALPAVGQKVELEAVDLAALFAPGD